MEAYAAFFNKAGRLRSGWRVGIFVIVFAASLFLLGSLVRVLLVLGQALNLTSTPFIEDLVFRVVMIAGAGLCAWLCNRWLEGLPWRAFGLTFHAGWWWDLFIGSVIGILSLTIAALIALAAGGLHFALAGTNPWLLTLQSVAGTVVLFIVAALAEETMFRGYPLQTLTRAGLAWLAIVLTSLPFAAVHLNNPNVVAGFTFLNTALAGVWLAMAYLRTRSFWFPLGVHWAWNWALGSLFGLPVSGMKLSEHPVLSAVDKGPAWLTGGTYGIEGGVACTIALVISTLFIWRTKFVSATPELLKMTSEENPARQVDKLQTMVNP